MKKKCLFFCVISAMTSLCLLSACGSSKQVAPYEYPRRDYDASQVRSPQQPKMEKREVDECILMANTEDNNKYRAYGTATSFQEEYALSNAEANAVTAMVQRIETAVEGARQFYNKDVNANAKRMTEGEAQGIVTQYFANRCKNYRVIKTSLYDLPDGAIRCYVCIELRETKTEILKAVENELSRDEIIAVDYDKQRFMNTIRQGLEDYKQQQSQE